MRRTVVSLLIGLGLIAGLAAAAYANSDRVDMRGICDAKGMDIYFWPQGHPAIPAIGFPAYAPTHAEFYKPRDASNNGQLAYMDVSQGQLSTTRCSGAADVPMDFVAGAPTQETTQTQKLRCTFTANADLRIGAWTKTVTRVITKTVKVKGKKKKARRTIRTTVVLGGLGSLGVAGATGAVAEVRLSRVAGTSSSLKWDTRVCTPIDVTG